MIYSERGVAFDCDGEQLLGVLSLPPEANDIGVVIIVGGPQYRVGSHRQFVLMARHLAGAGFPVLRFDTRGMGDSSGVFPGFESVGPDIASAVTVLRREVPSIRSVVLWGLCDAASAAMINGAAIADISGLVLLNPWVRNAQTLASAEVKHYYHRRLLEPAFWLKLARGEVRVIDSLSELLGKLLRQFVQRIRGGGYAAEVGDFRERMVQGLDAFEGQVLLILSGRDLVAAELIEFAAGHPALKEILDRPNTVRVNLPEADHTFSGHKHRGDVEVATLGWLERMLHGERA